MPRAPGEAPVKLYYRIGEVAELVGVEPHVLRYWESEFPSIRPQKSRSGQRVYSRKDVDRLLRVKDLLYAQRFTIAGARQRLRGAEAEPGVIPDVESKGTIHASLEVPSVPTGAARHANDDTRARLAALRVTLMTIREDVVRLLESFEAGADQPPR